jgi:hypothetical protein
VNAGINVASKNVIDSNQGAVTPEQNNRKDMIDELIKK